MNAIAKALAAASVFVAIAAVSGCSTPPPNLDLSLDKAAQGGHYKVALVAPTPAPAVNQLHSWQVKLTTAEGTPVKGAQFVVGGGMPQHGHGFPTKPRVTREVGDGTYLLEGMKFSMIGWWELKLGIQAEPGPDQVAFNLVIDPKGQRQ